MRRDNAAAPAVKHRSKSKPGAARTRAPPNEDTGAVVHFIGDMMRADSLDRCAQCCSERQGHHQGDIERTSNRDAAEKHAACKRDSGQKSRLMFGVSRLTVADNKCQPIP